MWRGPDTPTLCHQKTEARGFSATVARRSGHHRGGSPHAQLTTKATFRQTWSVRPALGAACQPAVNLVTSTKALRGRHGHPHFTDEGAEALKVPGAHPREGQSHQVCRDQSNSELPREPSLPLVTQMPESDGRWEVGCRVAREGTSPR